MVASKRIVAKQRKENAVSLGMESGWRIEEYNRKITELEAERQNLQTAPNAYPFLDVYRKYRKLEEITRPMVVELIEKIEVYEGNRVEITFRFQDEIADLLEELHQKQMGQREVSA